MRSVTEGLAQARTQRRQVALPTPSRLLQVLQHLSLSGVSQAVDDLLDTFDTGHRTQLRFDLLKTFAIQHTAQFG